MCQSSSLSVKRIPIPVISSIKFDENVHILVCKLPILLDSQVSGLGPQIKWFLENSSLFSLWNVICKGLDSVRKILSEKWNNVSFWTWKPRLNFSITLTWFYQRRSGLYTFIANKGHCSAVHIASVNNIDTNLSLDSSALSPELEPFTFYSVTCTEVQRIILSMPSNKSPGLDKISMRVIKDSLPVILGPLTDIVNSSFATSTFPEAWKIAEVI